MDRELLFSLSKDNGDFKIETFCVGGHGGQNMQKNATGVRITHPASGAVGESRDERSQLQNKKKAFKRLSDRAEFKRWIKIETAKRLGQIADVNSEVNRMMSDKNLKIEVQNDGKWTQVDAI